MYDINGDGTIDQKEMVEIISVSNVTRCTDKVLTNI